ncbi:unnamed protein product [Laminaria digitata]
MRLPTYRLTLAYDGTQFAGYARQPGLQTVEGTLRRAIERLGSPPKALAVAGRTDRGVSAKGQVVSFRLPQLVPLAELEAAVDEQAPGALACLDARIVPRAFHAAFSAKARRYLYLAPNPDRLPPGQVQALLTPLLGRRCFSAFARDTRPGQSTVRTLREARVHSACFDGAPVLAIHLLADAFLRKMVRVLVATALREASQPAPPDRLVQLAAGGDRRATAWPAPPEPLSLTRVLYDA